MILFTHILQSDSELRLTSFHEIWHDIRKNPPAKKKNGSVLHLASRAECSLSNHTNTFQT